jgi:hypothetical protein
VGISIRNMMALSANRQILRHIVEDSPTGTAVPSVHPCRRILNRSALRSSGFSKREFQPDQADSLDQIDPRDGEVFRLELLHPTGSLPAKPEAFVHTFQDIRQIVNELEEHAYTMTPPSTQDRVLSLEEIL